MAEQPQIIRTQNGIYVTRDVAERLKPYAEPPGLYNPVLSLLATPIYILPTPKPARWWVRAWRKLTKRRSR